MFEPRVIDAARYDAVVFDLDGVVTDTASLHRQAWRRLFDEYLWSRPWRRRENHGPFTDEDYVRYVDGRPRYDGVRTFLRSRGIDLEPEDLRMLGDRKDGYFTELLRREGPHPYPGTVALIEAVRANGLGTAVITASRHCTEVLEAGGLSGLFDVQVDGVLADALGLPGKPDPAVFLLAAHRLGVQPRRAVVVEDALAGVAAGKAGGFGLVIGVDRTGHAADLRRHGADVVVRDLAAVGVAGDGQGVA